MRMVTPRTAPFMVAAITLAVMARGADVDRSIGLTLTLVYASVCAASDLVTGYIFDRVTVVAAALIVAWSAAGGVLPVAASGAAVCGTILAIMHAGTRGRGLGLGDVKLGAVIGGGLGGPAAVAAVGVAFVLGAMVAIVLLLMRRCRRSDSVPFAPFLATGAMVVTIAKAHGVAIA